MNRVSLLLFSFLVFLFAVSSSSGQAKIALIGRAVTSDSLKPVPYAHVINFNSGGTAVTSETGEFSLLVTIGDSVRVSAVGFHTEWIKIPETDKNEILIEILMVPKIYELKEVTVSKYRHIDEFKKAFLELKLPDNKPELQITGLSKYEVTSNIVNSGTGVGAVISGPFSALYDKYSKHAKEVAKLNQYKIRNQEEAIFRSRYNPNSVGKITGLEGANLEKFMKFCNLTANFVANATDYQLLSAINTCLTDYNKEVK
jgi:hypothetical protein